MARKFRVEKTPTGGSTYRMQGARVGGVNYNGCLTVNISPAGIYLAPFFLFRLGHPPILIPFSAIQNPQSKKLFMVDVVQFDVGNPKITTIWLRKSLFEKLQEQCDR